MRFGVPALPRAGIDGGAGNAGGGSSDKPTAEPPPDFPEGAPDIIDGIALAVGAFLNAVDALDDAAEEILDDDDAERVESLLAILAEAVERLEEIADLTPDDPTEGLADSLAAIEESLEARVGPEVLESFKRVAGEKFAGFMQSIQADLEGELAEALKAVIGDSALFPVGDDPPPVVDQIVSEPDARELPAGDAKLEAIAAAEDDPPPIG